MRLSRLIFYALPALPLAALTLPLYIIVPTFYSEVLGLSLGAVGAALLLVRVIDALTDPLIGWLSDRWRPSFGRRRAFFLLSLPFTATAAVMLFWPAAGAGVSYLTFWGAALSVSYTATLLPFAAWGAELAGDYRERSRIAAFREGFTLVGTPLAIALPFAVGLDKADGLHGLAALGLTVAILLLLFGGLAVWKAPEPAEYTISQLSLADGLRHMAANRPFLRLIAAFFVNGLANGIPATLFLYFVSERLGVPDLRGPLLFLYFLAGVAGVPLAVALAARISKHRAWCCAMIGNCGLFALAPLLGPGDVLPFAVICAATGLALGFDLALPASIQADVIDVDTASSGEQRSGLYFAAWSLATKLSLALGVGIVFPLLVLFGFRSRARCGQYGAALSGLVAIYVWLPVTLKAGAIALMWNFPLDEEAQAMLRAGIEARAGGWISADPGNDNAAGLVGDSGRG